jgi:D-glycero-alpha-D-manno-heptose 1-phosphate guanylyltransferase
LNAIVLAGGLGSRLRSEVFNVPKPMAPVGSRPFLELVLDELLNYHIDRIILSIGYLGNVISSHFGNSYKGIEIIYCNEDNPLGTGGAIKKALGFVSSEQVLILNGDTFFKLNIQEMFSKFLKSKSKIMIALKVVENCQRYNAVDIDSKDFVKKFLQDQVGPGLISGGVYLLDVNYFSSKFSQEKFSFEKYIETHNTLKVSTYTSNSFFIDIGIPEDYKRLKEKYQESNQ